MDRHSCMNTSWLILVCIALAGCAPIPSSRPTIAPCLRDLSDKAFTAEQSLALAGTYELRMVSQWEDERGKVVQGRLELWAPDTMFQYYEPSWYAKYDPKSPRLRILPRDSITTWTKADSWRPLIGMVAIDLRAASAPGSNQLTSRDPFEPGVRLEGANLQFDPVGLGFVRLDGSTTALTIKRASDQGFSGTWTTSSGFGYRVRKGRRVPNPSGFFCARRLPDSHVPPPNTR
jgi:hypothetical protein